MERVYLSTYLAPIAPFLAREEVTDVYVNRPGEVWVETLAGAIERHDVPQADEKTLWRLARQIAALTHQGISREHPLLGATLPDGSRIQVIAPPATRGDLVLAVRKHVASDLSLDDYREQGAFEETRFGSDHTVQPDRSAENNGQPWALLAEAVRARKNILVSGGTSTGKTTFLNALLREVPASERLILIEDTPELRLRHDNSAGLLAVRSELGEARVTTNDLLQASLRLRPDRIIVGELRGPEAFTFLRAVNTGHPGSMTTLHADSPAGAIEQLVLMTLQSGTQLGRAEIVAYVRNVVDIYVQLDRIGGRRFVREVTLREQMDGGER